MNFSESVPTCALRAPAPITGEEPRQDQIISVIPERNCHVMHIDARADGRSDGAAGLAQSEAETASVLLLVQKTSS